MRSFQFIAPGLWLTCVVHAARLYFEPDAYLRHNATLHRRNSIIKFGGCDKEYWDADSQSPTARKKGKAIIYTAYQDALRLAENIDPYLADFDSVSGGLLTLEPDVLEKRYFADYKDSKKSETIRTIFHNIRFWYPWFFWDWRGRKIEVYCEVDQPNPNNYECNKSIPNQAGEIGGYAVNEDGKWKIVMCAPFFTLNSLDERKRRLDKEPEHQRNSDWMKTTGHAFLHEMVHLTAITEKSKDYLPDQPRNPISGAGPLVYGPSLTEELAREFPGYAHRNAEADNYAWYATSLWFNDFYGLPDPARDPVLTTTENVIGGFSVDGSEPAVEEANFDEISESEAIAFASKDYTPTGWLRNKKLRILPLGDSITYGFKSSDGNGYRNALKTLLTSAGNTVDMIGSVQAGNMADNDNEGHSGFVISQIAAQNSAYKQRPNIVLLHAGTNDMGQTSGVETAPGRLDSLVEALVTALPDATIIVARIIPAASSATMSRIRIYNDAITKLMSARARGGQHVMMVDMPSGVQASDLNDGLHPNDQGYEKMALKWAIALTAADSVGWIRDPVAEQGPGLPTDSCPRVPTWLSQGTVASGGALGSAGNREWKCRELSCEPGTLYKEPKDCADHCLEGQCAYDSSASLWACLSCNEKKINTCMCSYLDGKGDEMAFKLAGHAEGCVALEEKVPGVIMADIDGDGRDDFLHVSENGEVYMFWNIGNAPDEGPNAGKVKWLAVGVIGNGGGAKGYQVRFADLDGDGRAEFIWVKDSGSVTVWWNKGFSYEGAVKVIWGPGAGEEIATGIGDGQGVHFADMNGDGMADFIHLSDEGAATLYINQGRRSTGDWGWWGWGVIANGVGTSRKNIRFADMNGDGRADYLVVDKTTGGLNAWYNRGTQSGNWGAVSPIVWWNPGSIASGVNFLPNWSTSNMVTFGDLNGDGRDEYLYVGVEDSSVYAFLNGC